MASKRNSRVYINEEACRQESSQQLPPPTSYRSRRSSRSSSKEDMVQVSKDTEEVQRNGISIREATAIARTQITPAVGKEVSITATKRSSDTMSSAMSVSSSSSSSSTSSSSSEHPPAPLNGRPLNFGVVVPGVYRSSYPKPADFEYIRGLKLKTLVTLVKKDELDHELEAFVANTGIRQVTFNMKGTKKEAIPLKTMKSILSIVLDRQNYPLLIHCNHGKHRTGCVAGVIRKVSGWDTQSVMDEYRTYAEPKIRECDVEYIRTFQVSSLRDSGDDKLGKPGHHNPVQKKVFFRALLLSVFVMALWLFSGTQMATAAKPDRLL